VLLNRNILFLMVVIQAFNAMNLFLGTPRPLLQCGPIGFEKFVYLRLVLFLIIIVAYILVLKL